MRVLKTPGYIDYQNLISGVRLVSGGNGNRDCVAICSADLARNATCASLPEAALYFFFFFLFVCFANLLYHTHRFVYIFYTYTYRVARPFDAAVKAGTVRSASWDGMHRTQHKTPHSYTDRQIETEKRRYK